MDDFFQVRGKRPPGDRLYTILRELYESYEKGVKIAENKLKEKIQPWIENLLDNYYPEGDVLTPQQLIDAIGERVCEIAGHVWVEVAENIQDTGADSDISAGKDPRDASINAHVAEFLPAPIKIEDLKKALKSNGRKIVWSKITDEELFNIFFKLLFEPSPIDRVNPAHPRSFILGAVPGEVCLISPKKIKERSQFWFDDRADAYTTPKWPTHQPLRKLNYIMGNSRRYSYTPERYLDGDNCVTWMSNAMVRLLPGGKNWLDVIKTQCKVTIAHASCEEYHVKEWGSMRCTIPYIEGADVERQNGLRTFIV